MSQTITTRSTETDIKPTSVPRSTDTEEHCCTGTMFGRIPSLDSDVPTTESRKNGGTSPKSIVDSPAPPRAAKPLPTSLTGDAKPMGAIEALLAYWWGMYHCLWRGGSRRGGLGRYRARRWNKFSS